MDGRVKTLHPMVHGGLLAVRGNATHESEMGSNGIKPIDLVVMNLYAFDGKMIALFPVNKKSFSLLKDILNTFYSTSNCCLWCSVGDLY